MTMTLLDPPLVAGIVGGIGRIIGLVIAGLIVGGLARLFHPGRDPLGLGATFLVGIAAVILVGLFFGGILGFIVAVIVGVVLVAVIGRTTGSLRTR